MCKRKPKKDTLEVIWGGKPSEIHGRFLEVAQSERSESITEMDLLPIGEEGWTIKISCLKAINIFYLIAESLRIC